MPSRIVFHAEGEPDARALPSIEGLSDQTPGVWAPWEATPQDQRQPVFAVQRDIGYLDTMAEGFPDLITTYAGMGVQRSDEELVEWYFGDQPLSVDLTLAIAHFGRDKALLGQSGRVVLEGT